MTTTTHIKFGTGLAVTDEGSGVIRVDGSGGPAGATGPPGATGPAGPTGPAGTTPDISGKVDRDAVETATARLVQVKLAAGDTQPTFKITGDGKLHFGPGGTGVLDTAWYRAGSGVLTSNGSVRGQADMTANVDAAGNFTANTVAVGHTGAGLGPSIVFGTTGQVNLYRSAAGWLRTDGSLWVNAVGPSAGVTGLVIAANGIGARYLEFGPADSAGVGFRTVKVANV